ncbi:ATP synthase, C chain [Candidatus Mycoplasma haemominutum 'Birmingham 1']|uniref:ATP synthase subunit c n=2 Tax=Candidatus Mycoplasma haematominutum TaxID=209446 RepID=G8C3F3_9MOLU|nr:ATP synthase, C chain [Candidatus Mycoplasma haematominutum 'Birmingham 1']
MSFLESLLEQIRKTLILLPFADGNKMQYIGAGVAMLAGCGAALAQGFIGGKAIEALARNPEVEALIFRQFIVGAAVCESVAIYGLIIAILLMFAVNG